MRNLLGPLRLLDVIPNSSAANRAFLSTISSLHSSRVGFKYFLHHNLIDASYLYCLPQNGVDCKHFSIIKLVFVNVNDETIFSCTHVITT